MRLLFFGMRGGFSLPPLQALLRSRHTVAAVVVPATARSGDALRPLAPDVPPPDGIDGELPLLPSYVKQSIVQLAWARGIPVYETARVRNPMFQDWVRSLAPDAACVACFNQILPPALLSIPQHGFLNIHPSLLPQYRGPEPLFWQFRHGVSPVGVSVHWMDAGADTGDIAAQAEVPLPDGIDGLAAEQRCARVGADLLLSVLERLESGAAERHPQQGEGNYHPAPGANDFALSLDWSARRAFNFMRGTGHWAIPYRLDRGEEKLLLAEAVAWQPEGSAPGQVTTTDAGISVGFAAGLLVARPWP